MDWTTLPTGEPLLGGVLWALRCRITNRVPVGASILLAAEVLEVVGQSGQGTPLVYHDRGLYRLTEEARVG
jgi:flavin reductase (DIM6/NTAB) family NADH-FMN oxidoreductase RutF